MPLDPGLILNNRYRIDRLLGQGGFGAVYAAWDTQLDGPCAVKENLETSAAAQSQFGREARLLFNLRHPNLPRVFDYFVIPDQGQYLVMDYIEGEDLRTVQERTGGSLPPGQVLPWLIQVCDALSYMHSRQPPVIHRDIKPANIRITPDGQAVLVDFGIAKSFEVARQTSTGARALTPGFAPPEQYGAGATDPQSDVYALGATAYCLLTGQAPPESVMLMTGAATLTPVYQLNPAVPPGVSAAISQAMQFLKAQRARSAGEFKAALLAGIDQPAAQAPRPMMVSPTAAAPASPYAPAPAGQKQTAAGTVIVPSQGAPGTVRAAAGAPAVPRKLGPLPLAAGLAGIGALLLIGVVCLVFAVTSLLRRGGEARQTQIAEGGEQALTTVAPGQPTATQGRFTTPVVQYKPITLQNYDRIEPLLSFTPEANGQPVGPQALLWSPDSNLLAVLFMVTSNSGGIAFFDREQFKHVQTVAFTGLGISVAISPDGNTLAIGFADEKIQLFDITSATLRNTILDRDQPSYLAFSPDGSLLASSHGTVRLYQAADSTFVSELKAEGQHTTSIAFLPNPGTQMNRILASGTVQGKVILWNYPDGQDIFNWTMGTEKIEHVSVAANGAQVLTASLDGTLAWHPFTIEDTVTTFRGHRQAASYAAFNPAMDLVVSGGWDCSVRLWSLDGELVRTLQEISSTCRCPVALSPDGSLIASGNAENLAITLWGAP